MNNLINSADVRGPQFPNSQAEIGPLHVYLAQLTGEPFLFARISYGDELTLHFGQIRESASPKLKDRRYGAYVVSFRGSDWIFKSGQTPVILGSMFGRHVLDGLSDPRAMTKNEIRQGGMVEEGSRVVTATPFVWGRVGGTGIQLVMSDGSTIVAIPESPEAVHESADGFPELASWELLGPYGILKVGPGVKWEFAPVKEVA